MAKTKEEVKTMFHSGDYVPFKLKAVSIQWPHLVKPDTKFNKEGVYKVNLMLSKEVAAEMREIGFNVKEDKLTGEHYVIAKRKATLGAPEVTYEGEPFTGMLGNGSVVDCHMRVKKMTVSGREHLPLYLDKVEVIDLVTFDSGTDEIIF